MFTARSTGGKPKNDSRLWAKAGHSMGWAVQTGGMHWLFSCTIRCHYHMVLPLETALCIMPYPSYVCPSVPRQPLTWKWNNV